MTVTDLAVVRARVERLVAEELEKRGDTATAAGESVIRKANAAGRVTQMLADLETSKFTRTDANAWPETARNEIFGWAQAALAATGFSAAAAAELLGVGVAELDLWITSAAYKEWAENGDHLAQKHDAVKNLALSFAADLLTRRSNDARVIAQQRQMAERFLREPQRRAKLPPAHSASPGKPVVDV